MNRIEIPYGAEELRRKYPTSVLISFGFSLLLTLGAVFYPIIRESLKEKTPETIPIKVKRVVNYSELKAPPPIDLERSEPEIMKAQPQVKTVKYLPPKPEKDELVPDDEELPTLEELDNTLIGTENIEGLDSVVFEAEHIDLRPEEVEEASDEVFEFVEIMPEYDGGLAAFNQYLRENLTYPQMAKEAKIQGRVYVGFVVERDGSITHVEVLRSVNPVLDEEAVRVIEKMPPWNPGRQNQQAVRVKFNLPINFVLK
jgi:protein TonB